VAKAFKLLQDPLDFCYEEAGKGSSPYNQYFVKGADVLRAYNKLTEDKKETAKEAAASAPKAQTNAKRKKTSK